MRTYLLFALFVVVVLSFAAILRAAAGEPAPNGNPPPDAAAGQPAPLDQRQVLVRAQILEVSRTKLRVLGFDLGRRDAGNGPKEQHPGTASNTTIATFLTSPDGGPAPTPAIQKFIDALLKDQLAKVLSQSEIVVTSGKPTTIHMGPEIPIRVPQPDGEHTVEMINLGTKINCTAQVGQHGLIHLKYQHGVRQAHGEKSPETGAPKQIGVTEFDTSFDLQPGQTGAISQAYKREETARRGSKISREQNDIEVILLVTAELVEPRTAMTPSEYRPE